MAAKWSWQSDSGWVVYAPAVAKIIEEAHQKKEKKVKVDQERFVDLVDMFQRRYDDESKRRPVKRELDPTAAPPPPPPAPKGPVIFKSEIFYILASSQKKKDKLSEDAVKHGALIAEHFVPPKPGKNAVTHVICSEADVASFAPTLDTMVKSGVEIVTPEFVADSIVEEEAQDASKYRLSVKKNAASSSALAAASATVVAPAAAPAAAHMKHTWEGLKLVPYPFELVVKEVKDDTFTGYIHWPTLGNTKTKVRGQVQGSNVTFEEFDFMEGDGVELNNKYTAVLTGAGLSGTLVDNQKLEGTFTLIAKT